MYSPPNENLIWTVHRLKTTFIDSIGNQRTGTGFWVSDLKGGRHFVTNKHNVDPTLKFGSETQLKLHSAEIELRRIESGVPLPETFFFKVSNLDSLVISKTADCAVLLAPHLHDHDPTTFQIADITKFKDIATIEEFEEGSIKVMESAVFIGYPGSKGKYWSDNFLGLPIARQCSIASWPRISFVHEDIPTTDAMLVSGLSFSGSSGSPVFVLNRGIRPGGDINDPTWRPARLVGVMSGHFFENKEVPAMFAHTGLSYLTRSTSLIELFKDAGVL
ncbi:hypothetical protein ACO0LB_09225 [Undibacterium sp. SXout7W]|uniref:hypothetical protein n=1 Tax=Undibacterium sp. SXout7W TaxID=3413049 RepID=UPI003BF39AD2